MSQIIGLDEVGRGSWAGPLLVVAARARTQLPRGLKDSKLMTKQNREVIAKKLQKVCVFGEGWVRPAEIDRLGLTKAMQIGVGRALAAIDATSEDEIIIDGLINYCPANYTMVQTIIRADRSVPIVSAASIYAKVTRDKHMTKLAKAYPEYGFDSHVGYGTMAHRRALENFGACDLHRKSYKPVQAIL